MNKYKIEDLSKITDPGKIQGYILVDKTSIELPFSLFIGSRPGKNLLITAGLHGCEYVGIETSKELARTLDFRELAGRILIIHTTNVSGFRKKLAGVTYEDGLNLNRIFPGREEGNISERLAHFILNKLSKKSDFYIDMHGADLHGAIKPLVFYPVAVKDQVAKISRQAAAASGFPNLIASTAKNGSYSRAALEGVPSLLTEFGGGGVWSQEEVAYYQDKILNVLDHLGLIKKQGKQQANPNYFRPVAEYSSQTSGYWYPDLKVGDRLDKGQRLGLIKDAFDNVLEEVFAKEPGLVMYQTVALSVEESGFLTATAKEVE